MVRIGVDGARCQGHGLCYSYFPDLFAPDDEGYAQLLAEDAEPDQAHEAASVCPERAIVVHR